MFPCHMPERLSQARLLFEKYAGPSGADLLKAMPNATEKTFETEWLEFKTGRCPDDLMKQKWSRAIGAFANNEGGCLIWGLQCKKDNVAQIDAVDELQTVRNVNAWVSRLKEFAPALTDPPVAGIELRAVPLVQGSVEGFVVCYIPESNYKPHRSEYPKKQFLLRIGDTAAECSVSLLRQMFYPKRHLKFSVTVKVLGIPQFQNIWKRGATGAEFPRYVIEFGVRNICELSAKDVWFSVKSKGYSFCTYYQSGGRIPR